MEARVDGSDWEWPRSTQTCRRKMLRGPCPGDGIAKAGAVLGKKANQELVSQLPEGLAKTVCLREPG